MTGVAAARTAGYHAERRFKWGMSGNSVGGAGAMERVTSQNLFDFVSSKNFDDDEVLVEFFELAKSGDAGSLVRFSDGEAKILAYPDLIENGLIQNQLRIWFGDKKFYRDEILEIRQNLLESALESSHLCLPTAKRTFLKNSEGEFTKDAAQCQALWKVLRENNVLEGRAVIGTAVIHKYAQISRWMERILQIDRHFVFVTRSFNAVKRLVDAFNLPDFEVHILPGETWSRAEKTSDHYPDRFIEVRKILSSVPQGSIALIGGGVLAKTYCCDVARAGGIAFDCGALFDTWAEDIPKQRLTNIGNPEKMTVGYLING